MLPGRNEKILIAMFKISHGTTGPCRYEDIVVKAFELFPEEFQLRGYPQFPDSSDIHKPLYGPLKRMGVVRAANKTFMLTEKGRLVASNLANGVEGRKSSTKGQEKFSRYLQEEIDRIGRSSAVQLYFSGQKDKILDTDFFSYLGASVRTERNAFQGRLTVVQEAVEKASEVDKTGKAKALIEMHRFLMARFEGLIKKKTEA